MDRFDCGLVELKFADGAVAGTFSGYGAVFGNVDSYGDVIAKGAFKETLAEAKRSRRWPKMLLQHGGGIFGGGAEDDIPIGLWTSMDEDDTGLKVEGRLINLDTDLGRRVHGAMKEGALDGLSIGFRAKEFTLGTKPDEPRRTLKKVDLVEVSVVTFPANPKARTTAVKGADRIRTIRDFEAFLRDAGGFSHAAAKAIAAGGFKAAPDPRDEDGIGDHIAARMRELASRISA